MVGSIVLSNQHLPPIDMFFPRFLRSSFLDFLVQFAQLRHELAVLGGVLLVGWG